MINTTIKPSKSILFDQSGQSLIEALAALVVAIVVIVALIGLGIASMRSANLAKNNATAAKIANRDMEIAISIADNWDWASPPIDGDTYYIDYGPPLLIQSGGPVTDPGSIFRRGLEISTPNPPNPDERELIITVTFTTSSGDHDTILRTYVTNWH